MNLTEKQISRFWSRVEKTDSCWLWKAALHSAGYGVVRFGCYPGALMYTHRVAYELVKGPIPEGLHLDHLCRNPQCCNPAHLEAVTQQVNCLRGISPAAKNAKATRCPNGHPYDYQRPDRKGRQCITCKHEYWKEWYAKNKNKISERDKARRLEAVQRVRETQAR